ncbi:MAG: ECF transporter S component [Clostridia bacterium]|nr:ECF transporter S component [Clostridia bacterium]
MQKYFSTRKLCFVALFTAMNVLSCSFSIPVPGGHLYLCDAVICFAAIILDPFSAFIVGGVGAFLGDLIFYPAPMFVSLLTHGLQAVVISLIVGKKSEEPLLWRTIVAVLVGAVVMNVGYFLGRSYVYSTMEYAVIKIPYEILQALLGAVVAVILIFFSPIKNLLKSIPKQ